jgi:hypothetical protein
MGGHGNIEVKPHSLREAGGVVNKLAGDVRSVAGTPQGTGSGIGDPGCDAAYAEALRLVGSESGHLAGWMDALGANVNAASGAYTRTDENAIPGVTRPGLIGTS